MGSDKTTSTCSTEAVYVHDLWPHACLGSRTVGLAEQLDFAYSPPNAFQRSMQRAAASRLGSWVFSKTLHHVDRPLMRVSKGRASLPGLTGGLPIITLTTIGAKSGVPRNAPLVGVPIGSELAVIGSGWGMEPTPGWVHNLLANPAATIQYRERIVPVQARRPTPGEVDRIWDSARRVYPGFAAYPVRASHREIAVFVLEFAQSG